MAVTRALVFFALAACDQEPAEVQPLRLDVADSALPLEALVEHLHWDGATCTFDPADMGTIAAAWSERAAGIAQLAAPPAAEEAWEKSLGRRDSFELPTASAEEACAWSGSVDVEPLSADYPAMELTYHDCWYWAEQERVGLGQRLEGRVRIYDIDQERTLWLVQAWFFADHRRVGSDAALLYRVTDQGRSAYSRLVVDDCFYIASNEYKMYDARGFIYTCRWEEETFLCHNPDVDVTYSWP
ncbi:MAG: hypothetical protein ABIO70_27335 [Pseudomonadota bacterium]